MSNGTSVQYPDLAQRRQFVRLLQSESDEHFGPFTPALHVPFEGAGAGAGGVGAGGVGAGPGAGGELDEQYFGKSTTA